MSDAARQVEALEDALRNVDPDNPVAATRKVARIARRFRPEANSSWEAFRFAAAKRLHPFFEERDMDPAKAAAWAVVDPYYGRLERDEDPTPPRDGTPPKRSGSQATGSTSRSVPDRQLPDPSEGGQAGRAERAG